MRLLLIATCVVLSSCSIIDRIERPMMPKNDVPKVVKKIALVMRQIFLLFLMEGSMRIRSTLVITKMG